MTAQTERRSWMGLLAKADASHLAGLWQSVGMEPGHSVLRPPEIGAVMVRGRTAATGAAFNLGEMTVTRCAVQLGTGEVGHGYVQGRGKDHATQAALIDALMQTDAAPALREKVLEPLRMAAETARSERAAKAAATRVEFFTMVRGEDK